MGVINQITADNTTYDVQDLISRPILTQAEYNALEQAGLVDPNKDYHISDGILASAPIDDNDVSEQKTWSSEKIAENDLEVYSTDETLIGTYCGHGLYRKVITGVSMPQVTTDGTGVNKTFSVGSSFTKAIRVTGIVRTGAGQDIIAPFIYPSTSKTGWFISFRAFPNTYTSNPNKIEIWSSATSWNDATADVIIEYIKD